MPAVTTKRCSGGQGQCQRPDAASCLQEPGQAPAHWSTTMAAASSEQIRMRKQQRVSTVVAQLLIALLLLVSLLLFWDSRHGRWGCCDTGKVICSANCLVLS